MLENKRVRSIIGFLIILNSVLVIMCLVRIRFSYHEGDFFNNMIERNYITQENVDKLLCVKIKALTAILFSCEKTLRMLLLYQVIVKWKI